MKNFNILLFFSLYFLFLNIPLKNGFAQVYPGMSDCEFLVVNYSDTFDSSNGSGQRIFLKMYPVGATFNGLNRYSPAALYLIHYNIPKVITDTFIVGYQKILEPNLIDDQRKYYVRGAFDGASSNTEANFELGMALFRIEFWTVDEFNGPDTLINSLLVDWRDANMTGYYPYNADLIIEFFSKNLITFHFENDTHHHNIDTVGKHIKHWQQFGNVYQDLNRQPSLGAFPIDTSKLDYLKFPLNANKYNGNIHRPCWCS